MCEKAVDTLWGFYDSKNKGYISKKKCEELAKQALETVGRGSYFSETCFDMAFDKLDEMDGKKDGRINKSVAVKLMNTIMSLGVGI